MCWGGHLQTAALTLFWQMAPWPQGLAEQGSKLQLV